LIAYVDSSVLLRVALGEPGRLAEWGEIELGVTSELALVECLRTVDRLRLRLSLSDEEIARRHEAVFELLDHLDLVPLERAVLDRAAGPFPTGLNTLDALHLATALAWQLGEGRRFDRLLTHDVELGRAARACGFAVLGC
jgi:predicted nucleic acid-binding protein